jgi:hypothetical protein
MPERYTPEEFLAQAADVMSFSTPEMRRHLLTLARACADVTYPEALPAELEAELKTQEKRWLS